MARQEDFMANAEEISSLGLALFGLLGQRVDLKELVKVEKR